MPRAGLALFFDLTAVSLWLQAMFFLPLLFSGLPVCVLVSYGANNTNNKAPDELPDGEALYAQAQASRTQATPGSDGWLPAELKCLPKEA